MFPRSGSEKEIKIISFSNTYKKPCFRAWFFDFVKILPLLIIQIQVKQIGS
jgi:hypothetical protein